MCGGKKFRKRHNLQDHNKLSLAKLEFANLIEIGKFAVLTLRTFGTDKMKPNMKIFDSMKKSFIFDIDGTLIDTERTGVESLILTVKELMDMDMPYEEAYGYFGFPSGRVPYMLDVNFDSFCTINAPAPKFSA